VTRNTREHKGENGGSEKEKSGMKGNKWQGKKRKGSGREQNCGRKF
jgi:hypothetical protein